MKKILAILLLAPFAALSQSCIWISHNDSLFVKCGTDSTYVNEWTFYLLAGKMYNGLAGQVLKKNSNEPGDYSWSTISAAAWDDVTGKPTTTSWLSNSANKNFVTDAQLTVIGNTANSNNGDNATNTQYSGLSASKLSIPVAGQGAGGTVTQATNKSTGVTLNKQYGRITMNGAALTAGSEVTFILTNSFIAATDVVIVNIQSVGTASAYFVSVGAVGSGTCNITIGNASTGSLSQAIVLNYAIFKSVID